MNLRAITITVCVLLISLSVTAQSTLSFIVADKDNNQPVPLAYVNTYAGHLLKNTVQTDEDGKATITLSSFPCTVKITIAGYETYSLDYDSIVPSTDVKVLIQKKFSTLNEVVVTGVVQPVKQKDALSTYQVIPQSIIQAQGSVTLNDVLSKQLNMSVSNDNILGSSLRMQGMGGEKVKILMDGMPVNGREFNNINLSQINMNNVDRIEVIQGPMSVIYGTDAIGGVINVISKQQYKPLGFHAGVYLTTINKYNADGSLTFAIKKRNQVTLGGGRNFFEGWQNIDQPIGYHGDTMRTNRCFLFKPNEQFIGNVGYSYTAPSHFRLQFNSDALRDKVSDKGSLRTWDPFSGAQATDQYFYTERVNNRLALQGDIGKSGHWISQNSFAWYHRIRKIVNKDLVTMQETLTTSPGDQDTTSSFDYSFRSGYSNNISKLKYTVGYDVNTEYYENLRLLGHSNHVADYAVYTDVSYPLLSDKLVANGGLRGAYNTKYAPPVIPALSLLFKPLGNVQIRASYSNSFRAPSLKELYLNFVDFNHDVHGNANLKAENGRHAQFSTSWQAAEEKINYLQFIATSYFNDVYNEITLVKDNPSSTDIKYHYDNYAHHKNLIGNIQADGQYENIHFIMGYSYIHTFSVGNPFSAYGASEVTATIQYLWHQPGINLNLFYKFAGKQPFIVIDPVTGVGIPNGTQAAFSICDASFEKKLLDKKVQIIAGVKNIFNIKTVQTTGVTMASAHGSNGAAGNMLPRSLYTSININIDKIAK